MWVANHEGSGKGFVNLQCYRLLYKDPQTRSNRHVHGLFTCSNSPNVEVCASAILVGTLQTYTDPSQVKNIDGGSMEGVSFEREKLWSFALTKG